MSSDALWDTQTFGAETFVLNATLALCAPTAQRRARLGNSVSVAMERCCYDNVETLLASLPADFDAWNVSAKLSHYARRVYGFERFSHKQQVALATEYSTQQLRMLWKYYQVPEALGEY